jgi:hypothetical protein
MIVSHLPCMNSKLVSFESMCFELTGAKMNAMALGLDRPNSSAVALYAVKKVQLLIRRTTMRMRVIALALIYLRFVVVVL